MLKISVGIPTYNSSKYLNECLKSVLKLKSVNEIIISDDFSKNTELLRIKKIVNDLEIITDKKIFFIQNSKNLGAFENKLILLKKASNDFVYVLDSDNLASKKFDKAVSRMVSITNLNSYLIQPNIMYQFWQFPKLAKFFSVFFSKYKVKFFNKEISINMEFVKNSLIENSGDYILDDIISSEVKLSKTAEIIPTEDKWIFWVLNCGNFIVNRHEMIKIASQGLNFSRNLRSVDAIVFSYLWLESKKEILLLKNFYHHHRKRQDSVSYMEKEDSITSIKYFINKVLRA